jgi:hypothetical protein
MSQFRKLVAALSVLTVATALFASFATTASAQVPPYTAYGQNLAAGARVEAFIGGKSCGTTNANAQGQWILQIASNAPCSPADGLTITFTLNGAPTSASETWKAGGAPKNVAQGITLIAAPAPPAPPVPPAPAATGNAGLTSSSSTATAMVAGLIVLATLTLVGARAATRRR